MKITLFEEKNESLWMSIIAFESDEGGIVLHGHDSGKVVQKIKRQYDYESYLKVEKEEIPFLLKKLELKSLDEFFAWLKQGFSNEHAISQVRNRLNELHIKNEFSVW